MILWFVFGPPPPAKKAINHWNWLDCHLYNRILFKCCPFSVAFGYKAHNIFDWLWANGCCWRLQVGVTCIQLNRQLTKPFAFAATPPHQINFLTFRSRNIHKGSAVWPKLLFNRIHQTQTRIKINFALCFHFVSIGSGIQSFLNCRRQMWRARMWANRSEHVACYHTM